MREHRMRVELSDAIDVLDRLTKPATQGLRGSEDGQLFAYAMQLAQAAERVATNGVEPGQAATANLMQRRPDLDELARVWPAVREAVGC